MSWRSCELSLGLVGRVLSVVLGSGWPWLFVFITLLCLGFVVFGSILLPFGLDGHSSWVLVAGSGGFVVLLSLA